MLQDEEVTATTEDVVVSVQSEEEADKARDQQESPTVENTGCQHSTLSQRYTQLYYE